jgi:hypothetical protein
VRLAAVKRLVHCIVFGLSAAACGLAPPAIPSQAETLSVADTPGSAIAADGRYISWREHRIDDEALNGGTPLRGGDGLTMGDFDRDGFEDIASVHEDSNHLRIAFGSGSPDQWELVTVAEGPEVGAIEDVAIGDLNGDGWPDLVAACEEAHLIYLQNPGVAARTARWPRLIPQLTQGRGSWLRVFMADLNLDGRPDLVAPNKGAADIIDPSTGARADRATSMFTIHGDPLEQNAWREQALFWQGVPNTAMPVDIDNDGDWDVLAAERLQQQLSMLEITDPGAAVGVSLRAHPIVIEPGFETRPGWRATSGALQSVFADLDGDDRQDLVVAVTEVVGTGTQQQNYLGFGWLRQPANLDQPWTYFRIGDTLPDLVVGIALADIDGDGDLDAITGGYSGLNIRKGAYSGASREQDDPRVTAASTVGRIAWFENPGDTRAAWNRHDISRRVRGMYDGFIARDLDGDGDLDFVATRGNSGPFDGVFWLEQQRTDSPQASFTPARSQESRALPLPPDNWMEIYDEDSTYVPPNRAPEQ